MAREPFLLSAAEREKLAAALRRYDHRCDDHVAQALLKRLECRSCLSEGGCPECGGCTTCGAAECRTCAVWREIAAERDQLLAWSEVREEVQERLLGGARPVARAA